MKPCEGFRTFARFFIELLHCESGDGMIARGGGSVWVVETRSSESAPETAIQFANELRRTIGGKYLHQAVELLSHFL